MLDKFAIQPSTRGYLAPQRGTGLHPRHAAVAAPLQAAVAPPLLDRADMNGGTALMRAAELGRAAIASCLLAQGADATRRDESGVTAVGRALASGHGELARSMVAEGAYCDLASACALGDEESANARLGEVEEAGGEGVEGVDADTPPPINFEDNESIAFAARTKMEIKQADAHATSKPSSDYSGLIILAPLLLLNSILRVAGGKPNAGSKSVTSKIIPKGNLSSYENYLGY